MKTTQLFQSTIPFLTFPTMDAMGLEDCAVVVEALNSALQEWFDLAPDRFSYEKAAVRTAAPAAVSVLPVSGSTTLSASAFANSQVGNTVVIPGDTNQNIIAGPARLLLPFAGDTPGAAVEATVYDDALTFFDEAVIRVTTKVTCRENGRVLQQAYPLASTSQRERDVTYAPFHDLTYLNNYFRERQVGTYPSAYTVEHLALSQVKSDHEDFADAFLLRLDPIPSCPSTIEFEVARRPRAYNAEDVRAPKVLPVPDSLIAGTLRSMLLGELCATPYWADKELKPEIRANAEAAKTKVRMISRYRARPEGKIRTQPRF